MEKTKKIKVFIDTNIIISGTFFKGNEAKLLSLFDIELYTCDIVIEEAKEVVRRKLKYLGAETLGVSLEKLENSFQGFTKIVTFAEYHNKINISQQYLSKEADSKVLAAVLYVNPDYFVTGDTDFYSEEISKIVNICKTKDLLRKINVET